MEIINNINSSVTMGSISTETASEIHPYAKNDEFKRIEGEGEKEQSVQIQNPNNAAREAASI